MKEETKEKFWLHDNIITYALIIWAVASIGLMIYFSGLNQVAFTEMTFGQLFIIIGIVALARKQSIGGILTVTGVGFVIIPAINNWGPLFNSNFHQSHIFPIMISTAITLIGLAMTIVPGVLENMSERKCKEKVIGECVDYKETPSKNGEMAYTPVYQYTYGEEVYTASSKVYSTERKVQIGEQTELKINPKNPKDVWFEASKASKMIIYIFGACFFISGLGMLLTVLGEIYR